MPANVFDVNNAFVYYLAVIRNLPNLDNYLNVLQTDQVQITYTNAPPVYTPPLAPASFQGTLATLATSNFSNATAVQDTATFDQSETHTASFSVAVTEGIKLGAQTKVKASIPFLASTEVNLSAEATLSSTEATRSTDSQTFSIDTKINVPPASRIAASLVINSLQYNGTVTSQVQVSGQLRVTAPGANFTITMAQLFLAIKAKPPVKPFSKTDKAGNTFSFTATDLNRFQVATGPNRVFYTATSSISANFGASQTVQIQQFNLSNGKMVSQSTL